MKYNVHKINLCGLTLISYFFKAFSCFNIRKTKLGYNQIKQLKQTKTYKKFVKFGPMFPNKYFWSKIKTINIIEFHMFKLV